MTGREPEFEGRPGELEVHGLPLGTALQEVGDLLGLGLLGLPAAGHGYRPDRSDRAGKE
ncbi:hypothetical protein AB0469_39115 [Streptomyces sp. NPDC093801]|uniref:hypothetical protein n=1 Tax=Streptomyces sp. NPDC093801 TaxID=3155203 RepID=UPI00344FAF30